MLPNKKMESDARPLRNVLSVLTWDLGGFLPAGDPGRLLAEELRAYARAYSLDVIGLQNVQPGLLLELMGYVLVDSPEGEEAKAYQERGACVLTFVKEKLLEEGAPDVSACAGRARLRLEDAGVVVENVNARGEWGRRNFHDSDLRIGVMLNESDGSYFFGILSRPEKLELVEKVHVLQTSVIGGESRPLLAYYIAKDPSQEAFRACKSDTRKRSRDVDQAHGGLVR